MKERVISVKPLVVVKEVELNTKNEILQIKIDGFKKPFLFGKKGRVCVRSNFQYGLEEFPDLTRDKEIKLLKDRLNELTGDKLNDKEVI